MKRGIKNLFIMPVLMAGLALLMAGRVTAQTFTTLHSFAITRQNSLGFYTNADGANPHAGLILSGNTLYGTAYLGGGTANGTVFVVNTDGSRFKVVHTFGYNDGQGLPRGNLILSGSTLYGTA